MSQLAYEYWRAALSAKAETTTSRPATPRGRDRLIMVNNLRVVPQDEGTSVRNSQPLKILAPEGLEYREFQRIGIEWALERPSSLIGDDMGLGKTVQALGVINSDVSISTVLIVCPMSVALNWKAEADKWLIRKFAIGVATGKDWPNTDIVIAHWGIIGKYAKNARATEWDLVVIDEAHYAKNPKASRTKALTGDRRSRLAPLAAKRKMALSGTPIPNRPVEIYPILKWLAPETFKSWERFVTTYCNGRQTRFGWDVGGASNLEQLQQTLRDTVMIRRLKKDVLTELPPKTRQIIKLPAYSDALRSAIRVEASVSERLAKELAEAKTSLAQADNDDKYLAAANKLKLVRQVAFNQMAQVRYETALAKVPHVLDHVKDILVDDRQKLVIFAHHRDVIAKLQAGLETPTREWPGVKTVALVGEDSVETRQLVVKQFQTDPTVRVFLGSIQAAKEGITLTEANMAIFAEVDWVPGNMSQAEDRIFRIGQKNPVTIQHLVVDGSHDVQMVRTIIAKQHILDQALNKDVSNSAHPTPPARVQANSTGRPCDKGLSEEISKGTGVSAPNVESMTHTSSEGDPPKSNVAKELAERTEWVIDTDRALVRQGLSIALAMINANEHDIGLSEVDEEMVRQLVEAPTLTDREVAIAARVLSKCPGIVPKGIANLWESLGERARLVVTLTLV